MDVGVSVVAVTHRHGVEHAPHRRVGRVSSWMAVVGIVVDVGRGRGDAIVSATALEGPDVNVCRYRGCLSRRDSMLLTPVKKSR